MCFFFRFVHLVVGKLFVRFSCLCVLSIASWGAYHHHLLNGFSSTFSPTVCGSVCNKFSSGWWWIVRKLIRLRKSEIKTCDKQDFSRKVCPRLMRHPVWTACQCVVCACGKCAWGKVVFPAVRQEAGSNRISFPNVTSNTLKQPVEVKQEKRKHATTPLKDRIVCRCRWSNTVKLSLLRSLGGGWCLLAWRANAVRAVVWWAVKRAAPRWIVRAMENLTQELVNRTAVH